MFRSIRWRLQFWYAAVLAGVIAGFGGLIYWQSRSAKLAQIDTRLQAAVNYLDAVLRVFPPNALEGPRDGREYRPPLGRGPERPPDGRPFDGEFDRPPGDRRPMDRGPGGPPPGPPFERLLNDLNIQKTFPADDGDDRAYFTVWRADRSVLKTTERATPGLWSEIPGATANIPIFVVRGDERAVVQLGPRRTTVLVAKSI